MYYYTDAHKRTHHRTYTTNMTCPPLHTWIRCIDRKLHLFQFSPPYQQNNSQDDSHYYKNQQSNDKENTQSNSSSIV